LSILPYGNFQTLLMRAARRVVGLAAWAPKLRCRCAPNRLSILPYGNFQALLMQAARRVSQPRLLVSNIAMDSDCLIFCMTRMQEKGKGGCYNRRPVKKFL